jgi:hypothetical protein
VIEALKPDLIIMDKEENTFDMANECMFPLWISHIRSIQDVVGALKSLSVVLATENEDGNFVQKSLESLINRYEKVFDMTSLAFSTPIAHQLLPLIFIKELPVNLKILENKKWLYLIWRKPYMGIGKDTFIYSMFDCLNLAQSLYDFDEKYPVFDIKWIKEQKPLLLCSSEPYPFEKKWQKVKEETGAELLLINGELMSWFGIRSLIFLESLISKNSHNPK